ncbi:hypothetical protein BDP27DRAFT_1320509 [Rhodocollybia butyracea]|uniref:Nephrocystin 3-like N-terminal domain-containing protein n=1 Tax=Rhodocollybia butyracea TaxID=206335 RepID=A0A9P5UAW5_9AGAR|nr:hypothetical protein BDP27DRAFT_1320509 [Rhodocollybia butyracea]
MIEVFKHHRFHADELVGSYGEEIENLLMKGFSRSKSIMQPLHCTSNKMAVHIELKVDVEGQNSAAMAAAVQRAKIRASRLHSPNSASTAVSMIQAADGVYSSTENALGNFVLLLEKLQVFANLANSVAEIHPYADAAYSIISVAYKAVLAQMQRDENIIALIDTMDDIYNFVKEAEPLRQIESHKKVMIRIAQQTTECGYFISAYCSDSFFARTIKHSVSTTDVAIINYGKMFSELKTALLDHGAIITEITVLRILETVERIETKVDLSDLPYADGARFHDSKRCLPGTRESVLSKIIGWIDAPGGTPDGKRLFLLTGAAGAGKSAIAHSLAGHYNALRRLGSSIFADNPDKPLARSRLVLLFPTIARDLADLDPQYRHTLWSVIKSDRALRKTDDFTTQFKKFIIEPSKSLVICGPIVIVIDASEEYSNPQALNQFLSVLVQHVNDLPSNFRIVITALTGSRLLRHFSETMAQIYQLPNNIGRSERLDLSQLSKSRLQSSLAREQFKQFGYSMASKLVQHSHGSFQRMVEACDTICGTDPKADLQLTPFERYKVLISSNSRPPVQPDDNLYMQELTVIYTEQGALFTAQFKSVMGILLAAHTSLSLLELKQLSNHSEDGDIGIMLGALGALLQNTTDFHAPIIPINSSFYDFLQNPARSGQFFVDVSSQYISLAKGCLRVLNDQLCFNICHLASSYLPNTEINDLPDRIKKYITPELSYASQYWIHHLVMVPSAAVKTLAPQVEKLLQTRFFFWLEVLSVLGCVEIAVEGLQELLLWESAESVLNLAHAALIFVQTFESAITSSVPHIYLSGVRFWPNQKLFQPRFAFLPISRSQNAQFFERQSWQGSITSLAFSPDCKSLLSTSSSPPPTTGTFTLSLWDISDNTRTRMALAKYEINRDSDYILGNHACSGVFSPDGKTITVFVPSKVQVLDVQTGKILHESDIGEEGGLRVTRAVLQADGKRLAATTNRAYNSVLIYNTRSGKLDIGPLKIKSNWKWGADVSCMEFSSLGNFLACSTSNSGIWIWNANTGEEVFASPDHTEYSISMTREVVFSPDETALFFMQGNSVHILRWNAQCQNEQSVHTVLSTVPSLGNRIAVSPAGRYLVYYGLDSTLHIVDHKTNLISTTLASGSHSRVTSLAISSDGTTIAAGGDHGSVSVWQVSMPFGGFYSLWGKGNDDSGWIYGSNNELLAWVPPELREGLNWNPMVSGDAHGTSWVNCLVEEAQETTKETTTVS